MLFSIKVGNGFEFVFILFVEYPNRQYCSNPSGKNFRSLFNTHPVKHLNITLPSLNAGNFVALVEMLK